MVLGLWVTTIVNNSCLLRNYGSGGGHFTFIKDFQVNLLQDILNKFTVSRKSLINVKWTPIISGQLLLTIGVIRKNAINTQSKSSISCRSSCNAPIDVKSSSLNSLGPLVFISYITCRQKINFGGASVLGNFF